MIKGCFTPIQISKLETYRANEKINKATGENILFKRVVRSSASDNGEIRALNTWCCKIQPRSHCSKSGLTRDHPSQTPFSPNTLCATVAYTQWRAHSNIVTGAHQTYSNCDYSKQLIAAMT